MRIGVPVRTAGRRPVQSSTMAHRSPDCMPRSRRFESARDQERIRAVALVLAFATFSAFVVGGCAGQRVVGTPAPLPPSEPTVAPSPTPLPPPLAMADDLRAASLADPVPQPGAPCGIVDTFDTPLAPPDAVGHGVRWPYGRASRRYGGKIHAGEDWGSQRWRNNLGLPVHSIGHGEVILAQPLGWGRDQGVFIVRHTFADGRRVLSFYGHLEPTSVSLRPGACVARGDHVGNIGDPRSSPHLHFEIRDHLPGEPGPGYWATDPALAGWHPPSAYIRDVRIESSPGVLWTQPITAPLALAPGFAADGTFVSIEVGPALVGRAPDDGAIAWRAALALPAYDAVLDADGRMVYVADRLGSVAAYALPGAAEDEGAGGAAPASVGAGGASDPSPAALAAEEAAARAAPVAAWTVDVGRGTAAVLAPSPGGGVVAHGRGRLVGLDRDGRETWSRESAQAPTGWAVAPDGRQLVLAGTAADPEAANAPGTAIALDPVDSVRGVPIAGMPAIVGDAVLVYRPDGVWHVALGDGLTGGGMPATAGRAGVASSSALRLMELDPGAFDAGQIVARGAGAIVAHRGRSALRLFALDGTGRVAWDAEISALGRRLPLLLPTDDRLLAATADGDLLEVDPDLGTARRLFDGMLLDSTGAGPLAAARRDGRLAVIQVGERLVAVDPLAAAEWRTLGAE